MVGNIPQVNQTLPLDFSLSSNPTVSLLEIWWPWWVHTAFVPLTSRIYHCNVHKPSTQPWTETTRGIPEARVSRVAVMAFNNVTASCTLDNAYYQNLQKCFRLLATNQMLNSGKKTRGMVSLMTRAQQAFFKHFIVAMIKLLTESISVKVVCSSTFNTLVSSYIQGTLKFLSKSYFVSDAQHFPNYLLLNKP